MEVKILQNNIEGYNKEKDKCKEELMDKLLEHTPQVLLLSEFCYAKHEENIIKRLEDIGYEIILPMSFEDKHKKIKNLDSVCMMAIKKEDFEFYKREREGITLNLRYIEGTLHHKKSEKDIELFFVYVPQTYLPGPEKLSLPESRKEYYNKIKYYQERAEYKAEMLFETFRFCQEKRDKLAFIGGDFNTAMNGSTSLEKIFERIYKDCVDTDFDKDKPTWRDKRIDYALVSKDLEICNCRTTHLSTISDHSALVTTFEL